MHKQTQNFRKGNVLLFAIITTTVILTVSAATMVSRSHWQSNNAKVATRSLMDVTSDVSSKSLQQNIANATITSSGTISVGSATAPNTAIPRNNNSDSTDSSDSSNDLFTATTNAMQNEDIKIPEFWSAPNTPSLRGVGRDDPYALLNNRWANIGYSLTLAPSAANSAALQSSSSLTQTEIVAVRAFPITAFNLFDRRGAGTSLPVSGICSFGRVYTTGTFLTNSTTASCSLRYPLVALGGIDPSVANLNRNREHSTLYFDLTNFYTKGADGDNPAQGKMNRISMPDGVGSGSGAWVSAGQTFQSWMALEKQSDWRGALVSSDDKTYPLRSQAGSLDGLISDMHNNANLTVQLVNRNPTGTNADYGISLASNAITTTTGINFSMAHALAIATSTTTNQTELPVITIHADQVAAAIGTPNAVYIDASSLEAGSTVFLNNENGFTNTDGTVSSVANGLTFIFDSGSKGIPITIKGATCGSFDANLKNLIVSQKINMAGDSNPPGNQLNNLSIITAGADPFKCFNRSYAPTNIPSTTTIKGSVAIWDNSANESSGPGIVTIPGDADLENGAIVPPLTPTVVDVRIRSIARTSNASAVSK